MNNQQPKNFYYEVENLTTQQKQDLGAELRDIVCGHESLDLLMQGAYASNKVWTTAEVQLICEGYPALVSPHIQHLKMLIMKLEADLQYPPKNPKN